MGRGARLRSGRRRKRRARKGRARWRTTSLRNGRDDDPPRSTAQSADGDYDRPQKSRGVGEAGRRRVAKNAKVAKYAKEPQRRSATGVAQRRSQAAAATRGARAFERPRCLSSFV